LLPALTVRRADGSHPDHAIDIRRQGARTAASARALWTACPGSGKALPRQAGQKYKYLIKKMFLFPSVDVVFMIVCRHTLARHRSRSSTIALRGCQQC
jgi:hypothetical protein